MGSAFHSLGKFDDAIQFYNKALDIDKKCAMALAYKGLSLGEKGDIKDAIKCFKKSLKIDSDYDLPNISLDVAKELLRELGMAKKAKTQ